MTALPIVELIAYCIIGLVFFLSAGGAVFLVVLGAYERFQDWRVLRRSGRG